MPISELIFVGSAYLIGSLCAGLVVVRALVGKDIRDFGSGNVGARNAGRAAGKAGFALTLGFDFAKGAAVVLLARHYGLSDTVLAAAALAVVVGHIFSVFLGFSGGKGLATLIGVTAALNPLSGIGFALAFAPIFLLVRSVSLTFLMAFVAVPVAAYFTGSSLTIVIALVLCTVTVWWAHRQNIVAYVKRS